VISCQWEDQCEETLESHYSVVSTIMQSPRTKTVPASHINSSNLMIFINLCYSNS
jgi:hypothetical protein